MSNPGGFDNQLPQIVEVRNTLEMFCCHIRWDVVKIKITKKDYYFRLFVDLTFLPDCP